MLPDRVSNPGPLTYKSGALPIALRGPAINHRLVNLSCNCDVKSGLKPLILDLFYMETKHFYVSKQIYI